MPILLFLLSIGDPKSPIFCEISFRSKIRRVCWINLLLKKWEVTFSGSENQPFSQKRASSTSQFREHRDPIYCTQNISLYFCLKTETKTKNWKFAVFVGSISFIQSLCVNFKLMATAVLVVGRLVYVTMSDTVGPEFYSKTVNRTSRGPQWLLRSWKGY